MIDIESIGSRVKYHRIRNKISQEELADLAQVSRVHISYLERGERIPSMESFINIAKAYAGYACAGKTCGGNATAPMSSLTRTVIL